MRIPGFTGNASLYNSNERHLSALLRRQPSSMRAVMPQAVMIDGILQYDDSGGGFGGGSGGGGGGGGGCTICDAIYTCTWYGGCGWYGWNCTNLPC